MVKKRNLIVVFVGLFSLGLIKLLFFSNYTSDRETLSSQTPSNVEETHPDSMIVSPGSQQDISEPSQAESTPQEPSLIPVRRISFEEYRNRDFRFNPSEDDFYNLAEYVDKLLDRYNESPTGELAMRLRRALLHCENAPTSYEQIDEKISVIERLAKKNGKPSGHVVVHEDALKNRLYQCKEISQSHPEIDFDDLSRRMLLEAADSGLGVAAAHLALGKEFPGRPDELDKDFLHAYRERVGGVLLDARNRCDPSAIQIFASGASENEYWHDKSGDPNHIKYYANQLMLVLYYENNVVDTPDEQIEHKKRALEDKVKHNNLSEEDVAEAQAYGRSLYEKFCLN